MSSRLGWYLFWLCSRLCTAPRRPVQEISECGTESRLAICVPFHPKAPLATHRTVGTLALFGHDTAEGLSQGAASDIDYQARQCSYTAAFLCHAPAAKRHRLADDSDLAGPPTHQYHDDLHPHHSCRAQYEKSARSFVRQFPGANIAPAQYLQWIDSAHRIPGFQVYVPLSWSIKLSSTRLTIDRWQVQTGGVPAIGSCR